MIAASKQKIGELECVLAIHEDSADNLQENGPEGVVILCHGFGAGGTDLVQCSAELVHDAPELKNVMFVFPAAPIELDSGMDSRAWWPLDMEKIQMLMMSGEAREMRSERPEALPACRKMLFNIIDHVREGFDLPASKVVIGGFSQGAMLSTDVALNYPEPLGGLIAWSGSLINEVEWTEKASHQSAIDVFQSHGRLDPILPFAGAELLRDMLKTNGHVVEFVEFRGEHTIPREGIEGAKQLIRNML